MGAKLFDLLLRLAEGDGSVKDDLDRMGSGEFRGGSFVPFSHSRPTFSALSADQLSWYLWWRDRWSRGEPTPSTDGYRSLLAFELINLTWCPDGERSLEALTRLACEADDRHVARTMRTWSGDLAWELGYDARALFAYEEARAAVLPSVRWTMGLASEYSPRRLSELVGSCQLETAYAVERRRELNAFLRSVITDGDAWFREKHGCWMSQGLGRASSNAHEPYSGAVVYRSVRSRPLLGSDLGHGAMPYLIPLIRHLENLHRRASGASSKLKELPLPESLLEFVAERAGAWRSLDELRARRASSRGPRLRRSVVARLARESKDFHSFTLNWLELGERPHGMGGLFGGTDELVRDCTAADSGVSRALAIHSVAAEFVSLFGVDGRLSLPVAEEWARSCGVMLVEVLDALNTVAVDLCDAPVILEENGALVLDAEIAEVMPALLGGVIA